MSNVIYEHKTQGRTLYSLAFLIIAIVFVLLGANLGAPIYWYMPPGFALLFGAWWFMSNPNFGCRLTDSELALWSNKDVQSVPVTDIQSIERKSWMDGPDDFTVLMKDGAKHALSHVHFGDSEAFAKALEQAGLSITLRD